MDFCCFYFPLFCIHWLMGNIIQRIGDHDRIKNFLTGSSISTLFSFVSFSSLLLYLLTTIWWYWESFF